MSKFINLKSLVAVILGILIVAGTLSTNGLADAKGKKAKKLTDEEMTALTTSVNTLVKKVYASALFSPKDNENLVDLKIKLDSALPANTANPDFAMLYYKAGIVYREREYKEDSIDCFKTILENFPGTPYASKAMYELKKMNVKIEKPAT